MVKLDSVMRELAATKAELAAVKAQLAAHKSETKRTDKHNLALWNGLMGALYGEEWRPVRTFAAFKDQKKRLAATLEAKEAARKIAKDLAEAAHAAAAVAAAEAHAAAAAEEADEDISRAATPDL